VMDYSATHPERTRGLLLAGCTLDFDGPKHWPYAVSVRLSEMMPTPWFEIMARFALRLTLPKPWAELVEGIPFNRSVFSRTNSIAKDHHFSRKIGRYRKPVLFVNGEYDFIFRIDERRFLACVPQARLKIMRQVEHGAPMRRSLEFTAIVRAFAESIFGVA
jgi:pimeloyl-ACP methyl ester carboxylesterase